MKKAMLAFAALNMVLFAQISRADEAAPANPQDQQSVVMVNAETNEVIRVDNDGNVMAVGDQELAALDNQANSTPGTMIPAAIVGVGIGRCGVGVHVGPIGVGANGCHRFWHGGRWHGGRWHRGGGRWRGHWARLY